MKDKLGEMEQDLHELQVTFLGIFAVISKCLNQLGVLRQKVEKLERESQEKGVEE